MSSIGVCPFLEGMIELLNEMNEYSPGWQVGIWRGLMFMFISLGESWARILWQGKLHFRQK